MGGLGKVSEIVTSEPCKISIHCLDRNAYRSFSEDFSCVHPWYVSSVSEERLCATNISRDKARRLMQDLHIVATYPKRRTTIPNSSHKKYPYLLRDIVPLYPNHIWSTDITYIGLSLGFVYLTAIIDWYNRKILAWRLSNTMDVNFCIECLDEAFYGLVRK